MAERRARIIRSERALDLELTESRRKSIEKAYGHELPFGSWDTVLIVSRRYIRAASAERRGLEAKKMRTLLKKLVLLASDARSKLDAPSSEPVRDGLRDDVETLYKRYLREAELNCRTQGAVYGLLALSLDAVIAASTATAREIVEGKELADPEGTSWDLWVCFLHQILERQNLPRGIRKDRDKSDKSSAFVDFVEAMQSALPKEFRRFDHSRGALAQGMTRARRRYL